MHHVSEFLSDLDWNQLTGKDLSFSSLACAMKTSDAIQQAIVHDGNPFNVWRATTAVDAHHKLESLQPRLAWKPLDVIKKTIENTTQWGRTICQFPMKKHHVSRFPWNNRRRLQEDVSMDTIFMKTPYFDGSTCEQVYVGFM